jgi:hypothetical protein
MVARKVLRMPGLAQGGDHLTHNRFVAGIAAPLLGGVDSLTAHFGLQTAQHRVQLITTVRIAFRLLLLLLCGCRFLGDNSGLEVRCTLVWFRVISDRWLLVRTRIDLEWNKWK